MRTACLDAGEKAYVGVSGIPVFDELSNMAEHLDLEFRNHFMSQDFARMSEAELLRMARLSLAFQAGIWALIDDRRSRARQKRAGS